MKKFYILLLIGIFSITQGCNSVYLPGTASLYLNNDYIPSIIYFTDGSTKTGLAVIPNRPGKNNISFKADTNSNEIKLDANTIQKIEYQIDTKGTATFLHSQYKVLLKKNERVPNKKYWFLKVFDHPELSVYKMSQRYYLNNKKELLLISESGGTYATIAVFFKRPNEKATTQITTIDNVKVMNKERNFRKDAARYFEDDKALVARIKNKEYKSEDYLLLAKDYVLDN